jgi:hypothetical protein
MTREQLPQPRQRLIHLAPLQFNRRQQLQRGAFVLAPLFPRIHCFQVEHRIVDRLRLRCSFARSPFCICAGQQRLVRLNQIACLAQCLGCSRLISPWVWRSASVKLSSQCAACKAGSMSLVRVSDPLMPGVGMGMNGAVEPAAAV